ncbi:MAG: site-2 protease family protein [Syntrophomonadaceae bacterium]|nr:site-2 protease family protein [Syntrophomonadaceae bacterium]
MHFDPSGWLILLPGIIVGLTVHEYAHGYVADRLGDPTPAYSGRLTLNPLAHIDLLGFLMLLLVRFGWAKPVPINPINFRGNRRAGIALVALAGPGANLLVAFTGMLVYYLSFPLGGIAAQGLGPQMLFALNYINVILAVFNLIPLPPLDGSKILSAFLSPPATSWYWQLERHGPVILVLLLFSGLIGRVLGPAVNLLYGVLQVVTSGLAGAFLSII